jgi:copper chaperone CopZ
VSKTILRVEGLDDPSCVQHVSDVLRIPGIERVNVRFDDGSVEIEHEPTVSSGRLIAALELAGYEARPTS